MKPLLLRGDARTLPLADESVDLVVTSPPYFGLRSYQDGGEHYAGQVGAEASPREFVDALIDCTREMVRVLKPSGSIFVNLGDRYSQRPGQHPQGNIRPGASLGGGARSEKHVKARLFRDAAEVTHRRALALRIAVHRRSRPGSSS
jgi:DNA modification methylase